MTAEAQGYKDGRDYQCAHLIEHMTFRQYRHVGKGKSERLYVRSDKQREYLLGWWHAGEQFLTVFKQDATDHWQAEKRIHSLRMRLGGLVKDFEKLQDYREDDETYHERWLEAVELLTRLQDVMDGLAEYVKQAY